MKYHFIILLSFITLLSCNNNRGENQPLVPVDQQRIPVIIDTDANNELDDQHALAYLFFNSDVFDIKGVTVNATYNGGDIAEQLREAERVMKLCDVYGDYPLKSGADSNFEDIRPYLSGSEFDGQEAVDFIIESVEKSGEEELVLIPIGKLTNIALALEKAPQIKDKVRIVWLGSNYPAKGEYNQENDLPALQYILDVSVPFEMVTVRYGESSGSDAVRVTPEDIQKNMSGAGPRVTPGIEGRHGGVFEHFGDYAVDLFSKIDLHGDPPSRALFDVVAVAVLKNPAWGERVEIPAPELIGEDWKERPENTRTIVLWENFDVQGILDDFYSVMKSGGH